jgi:hypothetical protein
MRRGCRGIDGNRIAKYQNAVAAIPAATNAKLERLNQFDM